MLWNNRGRCCACFIHIFYFFNQDLVITFPSSIIIFFLPTSFSRFTRDRDIWLRNLPISRAVETQAWFHLWWRSLHLTIFLCCENCYWQKRNCRILNTAISKAYYIRQYFITCISYKKYFFIYFFFRITENADINLSKTL